MGFDLEEAYKYSKARAEKLAQGEEEEEPVEPIDRFEPPKPLAERTLGDVWVEPVSGIQFIWIAAGEYRMGSPKDEPYRRPEEGPQHKVALDGFWVGKHPVTWEQWKTVMRDPGRLFDPAKAKHPVERINWEDIQKFIRRLSQMTGIKKYLYRLPTEAEWEYAARAGATTANHALAETPPPEGDPPHLADYCWYVKNAAGTTQPVGEKKANAWGLHDTLGNVWELTSDYYGKNYYGKSPEKNPRGAAYGDARVRRGGCWRSQENACRLANRSQVAESTRNDTLGFRLVMNDQ